MHTMGSSIKNRGFTIVELLIVIVIIGILVALVIVAYNGIQSRARDSARIQKVKEISKAIESYYVDNGRYPTIQDGSGNESSCGSQTENWGHCDRNQILSTALSPYMRIDPTSLSSATQGNYYYYYTAQGNDSWQHYGIMVYLEGSGGQNDGGYFSNAYELGSTPPYCMSQYTGTNRNWRWSVGNTLCLGGN